MASFKQNNGLIRRVGRGFLWVGGKGLYFIFIYPLSPLFRAGKYLKLIAVTVDEIAEYTGQVWRQIRHGEREDGVSKPGRDFRWCLTTWGVDETDIDDRIMLWIAEVMGSLFATTIIVWSAVEWNQFWTWVECAVTVPALLSFISVRFWQIACLRKRQYIPISLRGLQ
ncbi:hypothetical protein F6R98_06550 [Candidatus Methylospira mobilis]|uniref:Uncharacterized protein n=1 Tax=Candidatus Methylospira mobilis TaxID=1808979 RepID=A0A5Q0BJJ1_9GAMM|nr:hypothetical protein [Candidatus Methylospira mobilis]QFY42328.1 hypothetical protein F6R98_06550 [Candidatus Methylospira mobilis]